MKTWSLSVFGAVLLGSAAAGHALEVVHTPVSCAAPDRYVRIAAQGRPAKDVAGAHVEFRPHAQADWYRVGMTAAEGAWVALLPRPTAGLARFEYRVALTGSDAATVTTDPVAVAVTADCAGADQTAVASGIVVHVPPGAPAIPPVPAGFSPVGATAPQPPARKRGPAVKILTAAGVVGLAGAAAAVAKGPAAEPPPPSDVPAFSLGFATPGPGAVLSLARDRPTVVLRMDREPAQPIEVAWSVDYQTATGLPCGRMSGVFEGVQRPLDLTLTAPVLGGFGCNRSFDAVSASVRVTVSNRPVLTESFPVAYRFEP
ncbi:MAG: hypothetical protein ABW221_14180 [Vicinamibacteria bacterium]